MERRRIRALVWASVLSPETDCGSPSRVQPVFNLPLMMTFGGIGSNQTRDQISGWSFLLPFVLSAAARRLQVAWKGPR
jgi:hypothetical protein